MQFDGLCFDAMGCGAEIGSREKSPGLPCIIAKIGDCGGRGGLQGAMHNCINNGLAKTRCMAPYVSLHLFSASTPTQCCVMHRTASVRTS